MVYTMIKRNIHLTKPQDTLLRNISKESGTPISEIIRRAIDSYIKNKNDTTTTKTKAH